MATDSPVRRPINPLLARTLAARGISIRPSAQAAVQRASGRLADSTAAEVLRNSSIRPYESSLPESAAPTAQEAFKINTKDFVTGNNKVAIGQEVFGNPSSWLSNLYQDVTQIFNRSSGSDFGLDDMFGAGGTNITDGRVPPAIPDTASTSYGSGTRSDPRGAYQSTPPKTSQEDIRNAYANYLAQLEGVLAGRQTCRPCEHERAAQDIDTAMARLNEKYEFNIADLQRQANLAREQYGIESPYLDAAIAREVEAWQLQVRAMDLQAQKLAEQLGFANEYLDKLGVNRNWIAGQYDAAAAQVNPAYAKAIEAAQQILARGQGAAQRTADADMAGIERAYGAAIGDATDMQGLDAAAAAELAQIAGLGQGALTALSGLQGERAMIDLRGTQDVMSTQLASEQANWNVGLERRAELTDLSFANAEEDARQQIEELEYQQALAEIDRQIQTLGHEGNMDALFKQKDMLNFALKADLSNLSSQQAAAAMEYRHLFEDLLTEKLRNGEDYQSAVQGAYAELLGMDGHGIGLMSAENTLYRNLPGANPARLEAIAGAFGDALGAGLTSPDAWEAAKKQIAEQLVLDANEVSVLDSMYRTYNNAAEQWSSGAFGSTADGTSFANYGGTGDVHHNHGSEAPSNWSNRNSPLYRQRAEFAGYMANQITAMPQFQGMRVDGVGYYRPPGADAPGRSSNSDHQSAGAIDVYGSLEQMQSLANWARNQPYVSFVTYEGEPNHYGHHVHISFMLGYGVPGSEPTSSSNAGASYGSQNRAI